jgi:hypothetical protein|tara:strand:+ start:205 stop:570 length:366 start_codon:yes stop_codon:yes gene_type:complete
MKAIVSFRGYGNHPLKGLLKEGFKHVVVAVLTDDGYWVEIDYCTGIPSVTVMGGKDFDLNDWYQQRGYITVETTQVKNKKFIFNPFRGNIFIANCVGTVKSVLGLDCMCVTPYQLYKRLSR